MMRTAEMVRVLTQRLASHYANKNDTAITLTQVVVLSHVAIAGAVSQTSITRETGVDRSTLAAMLSSMKANGLVSVGRSEKDRRAAVVKITAHGRAALKIAQKALGAAEIELLCPLTGAARVTFLRHLTDLTQ